VTKRITLATYNIHKGLSPLNRKLVIHEVRDKLHALKADILLLQEVQGAHAGNKARFVDWPDLPQHEHLAEGRYRDIVYGLNASHLHGDHGNAILSAFPVINWTNQDVSHHRYESRGHLMARIDIPGWATPLTCVCVHLGLFQRSRAMQIERLAEFLRASSGRDSPLIVAGDFNDWRAKKSGVSDSLFRELGLEEAFELTHGKPARTFPAFMPMLTLDRIYVRGLVVHQAQRLQGMVDGNKWRGMSDHAGLSVTLSRKLPANKP
jgi:endonuclease/exonuclease/phosphatase family metal-dependent hydrolase